MIRKEENATYISSVHSFISIYRSGPGRPRGIWMSDGRVMVALPLLYKLINSVLIVHIFKPDS